jgi:hypothetical protein
MVSHAKPYDGLFVLLFPGKWHILERISKVASTGLLLLDKYTKIV